MQSLYYLDGVRRALPLLVPGTVDTVAHPRPDRALSAVRVPHEQRIEAIGMGGEPAAYLDATPSYFHVIPQPGFQYLVDARDVRTPDQTEDEGHSYRQGGPSTWRSTTDVLAWFWGSDAEPVELHRTVPAVVVGRVSMDAEQGWMTTGPGMRWFVRPGLWIVHDPGGRNVRLGDVLHLGAEFNLIAGPNLHLEL